MTPVCVRRLNAASGVVDAVHLGFSVHAERRCDDGSSATGDDNNGDNASRNRSADACGGGDDDDDGGGDDNDDGDHGNNESDHRRRSDARRSSMSCRARRAAVGRELQHHQQRQRVHVLLHQQDVHSHASERREHRCAAVSRHVGRRADDPNDCRRDDGATAGSDRGTDSCRCRHAAARRDARTDAGDSTAANAVENHAANDRYSDRSVTNAIATIHKRTGKQKCRIVQRFSADCGCAAAFRLRLVAVASSRRDQRKRRSRRSALRTK